MLQPALLAVIRSRRQEKYPNGLHQRTQKYNSIVACVMVSTCPPHVHMPMYIHILKWSKYFIVINLCNDFPPQTPFFLFADYPYAAAGFPVFISNLR